MKLKVNFKYKCEIEVDEEELEILNKNCNNQQHIDSLAEHINDLFLIEDGRTEAGVLTDYKFEVEE